MLLNQPATRRKSELKIDDIEIHVGKPDRPCRVIGPITVSVGAGSALAPAPTIEAVNCKLRETAMKSGANAVINVQYKRGVMGLWLAKPLTATGVAVILESEEIKCPYCAEQIKREAIKCKHCGMDLRKP
jgi:zinc ribbon protein